MHFKKVKRKDRKRYENFKNLYFQAFPKEERRPLYKLWLSSKLSRIDIFALEEDGDFIGLLVTAKDQDLVWIDYLAIHPAYRGQGYGSKTLEKVKEYYKNSRIFLEVETPLDQVDNYHQRIKRIEFYKQNGFDNSGLRVNCFSCDFTILTYNGKVDYEEYTGMTKSTYGLFTYLISQFERLDSSYEMSEQAS
ncbi:MAG: GNAT family N-acetyltransferase [Tissierellia bacterium]|nr:GNAT family N-acetyltransferase [Tissierellia bacterium]